MDDEARTERLAQRAVNQALATNDDGTTVGGNPGPGMNMNYGTVQTRCSFDRQLDDGTYPLRQWRGSFTLEFVAETTNPSTITVALNGGTGGVGGTSRTHWCDAVPTNNLPNNPVNFAGPIRRNYTDNICIRWPDHDNAFPKGKGVRAQTNESCDM